MLERLLVLPEERTAVELLALLRELEALEAELLRTLEELLLPEERTADEEVLLLREALVELLPEDRTLEEELLLRVLELLLTLPLLRVDDEEALLRVLCWAEEALLRVEVALERLLALLPEERTLVEEEPEPEDRLLDWLLREEVELDEERVCAIPSEARRKERASTEAVAIVRILFIASQFLRLTV